MFNSRQAWKKQVIHSSFKPGLELKQPWSPWLMHFVRRERGGSMTLLVLLDLAATFSPADHGILLDQLQRLGVGGTALQWHYSYLWGLVHCGDWGATVRCNENCAMVSRREPPYKVTPNSPSLLKQERRLTCTAVWGNRLAVNYGCNLCRCSLRHKGEKH